MFPSPNSSSSLAPLPFLSDLINFQYSSSSSSSSSSPLDFSSIFLQPSLNMDQPHITTSMADDVTKSKKQAVAPRRKRTSKKDRHSKIYTAKGARDRRMRLSLDVARKFFDLQDMLGFDKASRTVEWLLNQSESSIDQVKKTLIGNNGGAITADSKLATKSSSSPSIINSECENNMFDGNLRRNSNINSKIDVRESRKMARARAKERTLEKMWIQSSNNGFKAPAHQEISHVVEEELGHGLFINSSNYMKLPSMELHHSRQQQLGLDEDQQHDVLLGAAHTTSREHLYTDLQLLTTKPWEAFNNAPSYLC